MDAILFVNGESTEKTLNEIREIGPLPENQSVELYAEKTLEDGSVIQSNVLTIDDLRWNTFVFTFEEVIENKTEQKDDEEASAMATSTSEASEHVLSFRTAYETALNTRDFSKIATYLEKGSDAYVELEEYIGDSKDEGFHYDFTSNTVISEKEVSPNHFKISTNETFTFTNHLNQKTDYEREKVYDVKNIDGNYKISKITYTETERTRR